MQESYRQQEARDFVRLIVEDEALASIDDLASWEVEAWLAEMGYDWNGWSWVPCDEG